MSNKLTHSIFFKLIIVFAITLSLSLIAVLVYSNQYLNQHALSSVQSESRQALTEIEHYISEKYTLSKQAIASLYNVEYYRTIPETMASSDNSIPQQQAFSASMDAYLQQFFSTDNDIIHIAVDSIKLQNFYILHRNTKRNNDLNDSLKDRIYEHEQFLPRYGITLLPAYKNSFSLNSGSLISMVCRVKSIGMTDDLGFLLLDFSMNSMEAELADYFSAFPASVLYVITLDGTIIYDSTEQLSGQKYPEFHKLQSQGKDFEDSKNYIGIRFNQDLDLYFLSVQPLKPIYQSLRPQKMLIYTAIFLLLAFSLLSVILFAKQYYRRISIICTAIHKIQDGNLETRIDDIHKKDELALISDNLNNMCDMLNEYIQTVYIRQIEAQSNALMRKDAELKQKAAELYALQTQINPHFLHNTLEAIRMRALSTGNKDISQMVYQLSTILRQSTKTGFVTSISEELGFCDHYLKLMSYRYQERLLISIDLEENLRECGIIRHILQPIIENSIQHGMDSNTAEFSIHLSIHRSVNDIYISVTDNGKGILPDKLEQLREQLDTQTSPKSTNIGLSNVHQRLKGILGDNYGITLESQPSKSTIVTICIPCMTVKEMEEYVQCLNS